MTILPLQGAKRQTKQAAGRKGKSKERENKNKNKMTNETAVVCTGDYRGHITHDRANVSIKTTGHFSQLDI